jgi:hypothetical protein
MFTHTLFYFSMNWIKSHFDQQRKIVYYYSFFHDLKVWKREHPARSEYAVDSNSLIWFSSFNDIKTFLTL